MSIYRGIYRIYVRTRTKSPCSIEKYRSKAEDVARTKLGQTVRQPIVLDISNNFSQQARSSATDADLIFSDPGPHTLLQFCEPGTDEEADFCLEVDMAQAATKGIMTWVIEYLRKVIEAAGWQIVRETSSENEDYLEKFSKELPVKNSVRQ